MSYIRQFLLMIAFCISGLSYSGEHYYDTTNHAGSACNSAFIAAPGVQSFGCQHSNYDYHFWECWHVVHNWPVKLKVYCPDYDSDLIEVDYHAFYYRYGCSAAGPGPGYTADPNTGECLSSGKEEGVSSCSSPEKTGGTNPVNLGVGNKYQIESDYVGSGAFPLTVRRTFNSISAVWQFLPEIQPEGDLSKAVVVRADGKKLTFPSNGSGGWTADPDITGTLESFDDGAGAITSWRYTTLDNQVEDYDASGKLTSITHLSGLSHTYVHTATDITVTHSEGGALVYQLDGSGRVSGFIDPDSNQYTYSYDTGGQLIGITYPNSGGTRTYHYEDTNFPNALTGITDANGDRFATWAYDSQGRAISSEHNNGVESVTIDYTYLNDGIDPRTTVTNALGKQTTYHFTTLHGVRKVTQVEGHPSTNCVAANKDYTYDANGFVASKTDWKGNSTTYTRNVKGQELTRTEAVGTPEERLITTEWHATFNLPIKITEPGSETTFTYDANGNQLSKIVTDTTGP